MIINRKTPKVVSKVIVQLRQTKGGVSKSKTFTIHDANLQAVIEVIYFALRDKFEKAA